MPKTHNKIEKKNVLITGPPRTGKTTLIKKFVDFCISKNLKTGGIFTPEIREENIRVGFAIEDILTSKQAIMASVRLKTKNRVGKYGVDIKAVEEVGVEAIKNAIKTADIIIIDEIGKMELFSQQFQEAVKEALDSNKPVLGTIGKKLMHDFAKKIKTRPDINIIVLNRQQKLDQLLSHLKSIYGI